MTVKLRFSAQPGAYERHLQRKAGNPLFSPADSHLLQAEIDQARTRDQQDLHAFVEAFQETVKQAAALGGSVDSEVVLKLREDLENLYVSGSSLAGDLQQFQQALRKLIQLCMQSIRSGATDDPQALKKLQDEEAARQLYFDLLDTPLVADLVRNDELIQPHELVPSLLSEEVATLERVLQLFDAEQLDALRQQADAFVSALEDDVRTVSQADEKLAAIQAYRDSLD